MQLSYQRFDAAEAHEMTFEPYCIKVFKQRWYTAGRSSDHPAEIRVYALDRVQQMEMLNQTYTIPIGFDAKQFFKDYYGIFRDNDAIPQRIIIRVSAQAAPYLRSLPLHASQRETERNDQSSVFEYYIVPTFDFIQELRTHGANIEVLSPQTLVDAFRHLIQDYTKLYQPD